MGSVTLSRGLSATWLKVFACVFMLVDHVDAVFHVMGGLYPDSELPYFALRILGRMSAPIFFFFVAEGCARTHDLQNYLRRLFLFALLAQLPFTLAFQTWGGSVILTLFLGASAVWFCEALQDRGCPALLALLPALPLAALAEWMDSDYGWVGVLMIPALYLLRDRRRWQVALLGASQVFLHFIQQPYHSLANYWVPEGVPFLDALPQVLPYYWDMWGAYHVLQTLFALVPVVLLLFYHGERGKGNKWFFYIFYPAHLLALYFLSLLI